MKQSITLAIDKPLLQRARAIAVQRGTSVRGLLAQELAKLVDREGAYAQARAKALAQLKTAFHPGAPGSSIARLCMTGKVFVDSKVLL